MTTLTRTWREPSPLRGALSKIDPTDPDVWADRLRFDTERAARHQTRELAAITDLVERRARELGARALILSGSTARGRRTRVSDLDYHVVGARPDVRDLPEDIDLYSDDPEGFISKLRSGDDFVHWSVWYGCVLFDSGVVQTAAGYVARNDAWPDSKRKLRQAQEALEFAARIIASGDYAAALEQVRVALSLTARWWLLAHEVFPLARDEMPDQLIALGQKELAQALRSSIHEKPDLVSLSEAVASAEALTATAPVSVR